MAAGIISSVAGNEVTGWVSVGDARIHYRDAGTGPPILLITGGTGDADCWLDSYTALAQSNRVIAYDRRGHSRSSGPPSSDLHLHAEDAATVLTRLDAAPATVLGWSIGGVIALDLAINHPELVHRLILIEPPLHLKKEFDFRFLAMFARVALLRRLRGDRAAADAFKRFVDGLSWDRIPARLRERMLANSTALMADLDAGTGEHLSEEQIRRVTVPTLLLYGTASPPILHRPVKRLGTLMKAAHLQEIEGAGHLMHFDRPKDFEAAVMRAASSTATLTPSSP